MQWAVRIERPKECMVQIEISCTLNEAEGIAGVIGKSEASNYAPSAFVNQIRAAVQKATGVFDGSETDGEWD